MSAMVAGANEGAASLVGVELEDAVVEGEDECDEDATVAMELTEGVTEETATEEEFTATLELALLLEAAVDVELAEEVDVDEAIYGRYYVIHLLTLVTDRFHHIKQ